MNDTSKKSVHLGFLEELKKHIDENYDRTGYSSTWGESIADKQSLAQYLQKGHFHKNFYTNYHALYNLFYCGQSAISIPEKFYVYDIACGPYTATVSLLNFLRNEGNLTGKSFALNFCEKENWLLGELRDANKDTEQLYFPVPLSLFGDPRFGVGDIVNRFDDLIWRINTKQCANSGCNQHSCREVGQMPEESSNALNLILCSYPGTHHFDRKFIGCIANTVYRLPHSKKNLPTYIVYSHYRYSSSRIVECLGRLNIKLVGDNANEKVPFSNCYYCIFRSEIRDAAT